MHGALEAARVVFSFSLAGASNASLATSSGTDCSSFTPRSLTLALSAEAAHSFAMPHQETSAWGPSFVRKNFSTGTAA